MEKNNFAEIIKNRRKEMGLTQQEFAFRAGLGLRFVRELQQGKQTVRLDKLNQALEFLSLKIKVVDINE